MKFKPTPEHDALLREVGSSNKEKSLAAQRELAVALTLPLREGLMSGEIYNLVFSPVTIQGTSSAEFPLHWLAPGTEKDYVAYTIPKQGYIPRKQIEGDYVQVPTYRVGGSIDWALSYARDARWDIVGSAFRNLQAQFVKKLNDDGIHTVIAAAADRNIIVHDPNAGAGQFTKRVVSFAKIVMRRNGGGNSTSVNRGALTHILMSPEAEEDMRNWSIDQIDEVTRREIYVKDDGGLNRVFQVNLVTLDELGEAQEYQTYYLNELGGSLPSGDLEIAVGLDLSHDDSFYMPIKEDVQVFVDDNLHREQRAGYYAWWEGGFAALDNRRSILLSW